jgi:hypothetical protein
MRPLARPAIERTRPRTRPGLQVTPDDAIETAMQHAEAELLPASPPADAAMNLAATDRIPLRALSAAGLVPARRRLGWGWWVALAIALGFFLACVALFAS